MKKTQNGFAVFEIIIILALVFVLGIVGWYAWSHMQTKTSVNIQPDFSAARTLQENNNKVVIDFSKCTPDKRRFDTSFGSTTIEIQGKNQNNCMLAYGGEVENPNWDGKLPTTCRVPADLGQKEFTIGQNGVDLSSIQKYCSS